MLVIRCPPRGSAPGIHVMNTVATIIISSLASTGLTAALLWFFKELIKARITGGVEHSFNVKLASLESNLRSKEKDFEQQLRDRESEIAAIRNSALAAISSRQTSLDARRLQAVEQIWESMMSLNKMRYIAVSVAVVNYQGMLEEAKKQPSAMDQFLDAMGGNFDVKVIDSDSANRARPFVTEIVWAHYSAFQAILFYSFMIVKALKARIEADKIADLSRVRKLVVAVIPEVKDSIATMDQAAFSALLEEIEIRLLRELGKMLADPTSDEQTVKRATEINEQVTALVDASKKVAKEVEGA